MSGNENDARGNHTTFLSIVNVPVRWPHCTRIPMFCRQAYLIGLRAVWWKLGYPARFRQLHLIAIIDETGYCRNRQLA